MNTPISTIRMKDNKTQYQVKRETGDKIRKALLDLSKHIFIEITELNNLTINTTEIKDVINEFEMSSAPTLDEQETPEVQEWRRKKMDELRASWSAAREQMKV